MINFHPKQGALLLCRFEPGFKAPEMTKTRVVVVMTPRLRRRDGLCTVIPLSTTPPHQAQDYHCEVEMTPELPAPWEGASKWAKADMLSTVGFERLSLIGLGRDHEGKRKYSQQRVSDKDFKQLQACMLHALNVGRLTPHL